MLKTRIISAVVGLPLIIAVLFSEVSYFIYLFFYFQ